MGCSADATLNPTWQESLIIPLPTPKSLLPSAHYEQNKSDSSPPLAQLPLTSYRELLQFWGLGSLRIEIVDTDRFNSDIHLGEVTLLLSSLMSTTYASGRRQSTSSSSSFSTPTTNSQHQLEMSGTYPLSKGEGSSRVSGTVTLRAYTHLPLSRSPPCGTRLSDEMNMEAKKQGKSQSPTVSATPQTQSHLSRARLMAGLSQQLSDLSQSIESFSIPTSTSPPRTNPQPPKLPLPQPLHLPLPMHEEVQSLLTTSPNFNMTYRL